MHLHDALTRVASLVGIDPTALIAYADEDEIGGFHFDLDKRKWDVGSMWAVEAQFIYALIRATRPARVLEIGVGNGCTSTHILTALHLNKKGKLVSLDPSPYTTDNVPQDLRKRWQYVAVDAVQWLADHPTESFDIVIEDGPHSHDFTRDALSRVHANLIMSHDAAHFLVGEAVRSGFIEALGSCDIYSIEPSDCGIGLWLKH